MSSENFQFSHQSAETIKKEFAFLKGTIGWKLMMEWVDNQMKELSDDVMLRVDSAGNQVAYTANDMKKIRYNELNSLKSLPDLLSEFADKAAVSYGGEKGVESIPTNSLPPIVSAGVADAISAYGGQQK